MPTTGATGTSPFVAGDVVFRPREFTTAITTWANVPYCETDFANYGDFATDHLVTVHNPATGVGDICRYMGMVDGTKWRIPTAAEWNELYGSDQTNGGQSVKLGEWVANNYYPLRGRAFGAGRNSVTIIGDGVAAQVMNVDPNIDGALFLPASGRRNLDNGAIYNIGTYGYYWSSTAITIGNSNDILFNSTDVTPQNSAIRRYAFNVRCIRE